MQLLSHIIPLILLIVGLFIKGLLPGNLINSIIDKIPDNLMGYMLQFEGDNKTSSDKDTEELDFHRDEDGNLILVLPEGYEVGGLPDDD